MEDERKELQLLIYDDSGLVSRSGRHLVESPPAFLLVQTAHYGTTRCLTLIAPGYRLFVSPSPEFLRWLSLSPPQA